MKIILTVCVVLCLLQSSLAQSSQKTYTLVITNVNLVNVVGDKIVPNRLLAISHNTIQAVDDTKKQKQYKALKYVDAKGKYALPGLWDMHVHFRGGDSLVNANKALLPLFLAYGITRVRDCGGDIVTALKVDGSGSEYASSLEVQTMLNIKITFGVAAVEEWWI